MRRRLFVLTSAAAATRLGAVSAQTLPAASTIAPYGSPSHFESAIIRRPPGVPSPGLTPLANQLGTITPSGLHFVRDHAGTPDIDPLRHTLTIHGLVKRPLTFTLADIMRFPAVERTHFIECAGNSAPGWETLGTGVQFSHGLISNSAWFGVPIKTLLDEAELAPGAAWVIAEGADDATFDRSIPLEKMLDDALLAYGQNGEHLRPEQGYPMRLVLPGFEGSASIKWLRRLKVTSAPGYSREETAQYADDRPDGTVRAFDFVMGPKSVITSPSPGQRLAGAGFYEVRGFAWSGNGAIRSVDISFDGGATWRSAAVQNPNATKAFALFTSPFPWDGNPCSIASRATDERGAVQPTKRELIAARGTSLRYHINSIAMWMISRDGSVGVFDA